MIIELKWLDPNPTQNHRTEIYRSDELFGDIVDATLIATTEPGITTYADNSVIQNQIYYYRLRFIQPGRKAAVSGLYQFRASPYTGPGDNTFKFGDETFGYLGSFDNSPSVPSFNEIRELFGLSPIDTTTYNSTVAHKFAIGGSIRGVYSYPLALGTELPRTHPLMIQLLTGDPVVIDKGLHRWALILPSGNHVINTENNIKYFPGELRSMLGVITELYTRVEDVTYGNRTGGKLTYYQGVKEFYNPLSLRYPNQTINYIVTTDWVGNTCSVINWTAADTQYPIKPKELHIEDIDYTDTTKWDQTLIWPVLVYTSLTGPTE